MAWHGRGMALHGMVGIWLLCVCYGGGADDR